METFSLAVCFLCVSRENLETRTVGGGRGGGFCPELWDDEITRISKGSVRCEQSWAELL